ncbi:HNH/ENDO VII family nuclease [Photobacterium damselae subsp. piscicida]|nr:HNH/ENDO VII family nuclease [Photobacterium damselae subsp. piscicida]MDP2543860.1 HNH/ENDO VII family nuclease [Photobacterium damselae subsp. piscicida]MDP2567605.1 HNH/ENDO VII family nuclease [Photobacterium damselae subsp. piscicida]
MIATHVAFGAFFLCKIVERAADKFRDVTKGVGKNIPNCDLRGPPNKCGKASIGNDGHPVNLHHRNQKPEGSLDKMTRTNHKLRDNFKKNHTNTGQEPSQIDRKAWRKEQNNLIKNKITEYFEVLFMSKILFVGRSFEYH